MSARPQRLIRCRARLGDVECLDGQPTRVQFGTNSAMNRDATFDGETIVCDACYLALLPITRSGQALDHEIPEAIEGYRCNLAHAQAHENPAQLIAEASAALASVREGSPYWASANAMREMAEREVARREQGGERVPLAPAPQPVPLDAEAGDGIPF